MQNAKTIQHTAIKQWTFLLMFNNAKIICFVIEMDPKRHRHMKTSRTGLCKTTTTKYYEISPNHSMKIIYWQRNSKKPYSDHSICPSSNLQIFTSCAHLQSKYYCAQEAQEALLQPQTQNIPWGVLVGHNHICCVSGKGELALVSQGGRERSGSSRSSFSLANGGHFFHCSSALSSLQSARRPLR